MVDIFFFSPFSSPSSTPSPLHPPAFSPNSLDFSIFEEMVEVTYKIIKFFWGWIFKWCVTF